VRGGFESPDGIVEIVCEEIYAPGELDPEEVASAVEAAVAAHEVAQVDWPATTDCDRLDAVFIGLNQRGIIALQNAGYTQSDGHDDFRQALQDDPDPKRVMGYCFYHGQDLERAVHGHGLYLAFGPVDPQDEDTGGPAVGRIIAEELQRAGFTIEWDGTFKQRIFIPCFDWKRRTHRS
jgi:hypothetical protein